MKPVRWFAGLYLLMIFSMASFAAIKVEIQGEEARLTESTLEIDSADVKKFYEAVKKRDDAVVKARTDFRNSVQKPTDASKIEASRSAFRDALKTRNDAIKTAEKDLAEPQQTFVDLITKQMQGMGKPKPFVTENKGDFVIHYDKLEGEPRPTVTVRIKLVPPSADGKTGPDFKADIKLTNSKRK